MTFAWMSSPARAPSQWMPVAANGTSTRKTMNENTVMKSMAMPPRKRLRTFVEDKAIRRRGGDIAAARG